MDDDLARTATLEAVAPSHRCDTCRLELPVAKFQPKPHDRGARYSTCRDCKAHTHEITCARCGRPDRARAHNAKHCRPCSLLQALEVRGRSARKCHVCGAKFTPLHPRDHRCGGCSKPSRSMVPGTCNTCGGDGHVWSLDEPLCLPCIKRADNRQDLAAALRRRIRERAPARPPARHPATFIRDLLAAGACSARAMYAHAADAGISARTLRREAGRLGVVKSKGGLTEGWRWSLPEAVAARKEAERAAAAERDQAERAAAAERERAATKEAKRLAAKAAAKRQEAEQAAAEREEAEQAAAERIAAAAAYCHDLLDGGRVVGRDALLAELSPMGLSDPETIRAALAEIGAESVGGTYRLPAEAQVIPFRQREVA